MPLKTYLADWLTTLGLFVSNLIPHKNRSGLFFFFPYYHVGGAEKVHASIVSCFAEIRPWVFFTLRSKNGKFKPLFENKARLFDIWPATYIPSFSAGVLAGLINRHKDAVVFGCNSLLFYRLLPLLKPSVRRIDLLHAFGGGMEYLSLNVVHEIDSRIVITKKTLDDYFNLYRENGIDPKFVERIVTIGNRVSVPAQYPAKERNKPIKILYVGRGTEEKRVNLVGRIASRCLSMRLSVEFILVGDIHKAINPEDRKYCVFKGEIASGPELDNLYRTADLLLLTSSREGFPIVIMEAMANGVVPLCTDVGGISDHIRNGINGILIDNYNEAEIVRDMAKAIRDLLYDNGSLDHLSKKAYEYAKDNFSNPNFCAEYKKVFNPNR